jgi:isopenicillin-N epimerase
MNELMRHWTLDPQVTFLNHGSFGACPRVVLAAQQEIRAEIERQPVEFFVRRLADRIDDARVRIAAFLGADPEGLVAVSNATSGVNAVLRSLEFQPGDELLTTDHEYNACRNTLDYVAGRSGARVVPVTLPFPLDGPEAIEQALLEAVTPQTRLLLIDHVTSPTGIILPIERLIPALDERGVDTLVDGAHAPGALDLKLDAIGAAYYVGHCHKWLCAPKGAAVLYVRADRRDRVRPLTISHGANTPRPGRSRYHDEFDWTGTSDPSAFLCVPLAIEYLESLVPGGWPEILRRNHALAVEARSIVAAALDVAPPCPDAMISTLAALALPDGSSDPPATALYADPLQQRLLGEYGIEVPIVPWPAPPKRLVRMSAHLYNDSTQYESLAGALRALL